MSAFCPCRNGQSLPFGTVPVMEPDPFRAQVLARIQAGGRICALFGFADGRALSLVAVLAFDAHGRLELGRTRISDAFDALTPDAPQAHWFEREIAEQWDLVPRGHPWPKPIRFQRPWNEPPENQGPAAVIEPGVTDYFRVDGQEVHEVAVGPVHAGIIEPGHFRFQCHGENVLHLEIELGYQHRGIERALIGGPDRRTGHYMETLAGDTTIGHATAHALLMEGLAGSVASARAQAIRSIALELERLANHTGDLGALAADIGYLPTAAYCGRLRGDFLNATALLCGNRFGRGLIRPGGVRFDLSEQTAVELENRLTAAFRDVQNAVDLLWHTPSVMARLEDTGRVSAADAVALGWVGPCARACDVVRDVRYDFAFDAYQVHLVPPAAWPTGDVYARAQVRWLEIQRSMEFILQQLHELPAGRIGKIPMVVPAADRIAVCLVEGWRGEICHVAITGDDARFRTYKVVDPSFHNWFALALALRGQQISDFPLCNKSFNLSYCGHDL
jgi:Ni,Fe-hydrogenase III large subunit